MTRKINLLLILAFGNLALCQTSFAGTLVQCHTENVMDGGLYLDVNSSPAGALSVNLGADSISGGNGFGSDPGQIVPEKNGENCTLHISQQEDPDHNHLKLDITIKDWKNAERTSDGLWIYTDHSGVQFSMKLGNRFLDSDKKINPKSGFFINDAVLGCHVSVAVLENKTLGCGESDIRLSSFKIRQ